MLRNQPTRCLPSVLGPALALLLLGLAAAAPAAAQPFKGTGTYSLFSLGLSHEGRTVWAGKVSDNVAVATNLPGPPPSGRLHRTNDHQRR